MDFKDSGRGRAVISENSEYLKNYKIPHIFIAFSRNRAACHAKWCIIIFVKFQTFWNRWGQNGNIFGDHTSNCNAMFERVIYILLSGKLVHKKHRDHLHGIGYFFLQNLKGGPVKTIYSEEITKIISYFSEIWENFPRSSTFWVILWWKH